MKSKMILFFVFNMMLAVPFVVFGQSMTSTNYSIQGDTFSGGNFATSTNFGVIDAVGQWFAESSTSTNYKTLDWFTASFTSGTLSSSLSGSSISFGELSTDSVSSQSLVITVTTDSSSGYTVKMSENTNFIAGSETIDDVSDGAVTAGVEEYGIRTSGVDGQFNSVDTSITSNLKTVALKTTVASAVQTTVSFKAAISQSTVAGSYTHTVTFSTVANF